MILNGVMTIISRYFKEGLRPITLQWLKLHLKCESKKVAPAKTFRNIFTRGKPV